MSSSTHRSSSLSVKDGIAAESERGPDPVPACIRAAGLDETSPIADLFDVVLAERAKAHRDLKAELRCAWAWSQTLLDVMSDCPRCGSVPLFSDSATDPQTDPEAS